MVLIISSNGIVNITMSKVYEINLNRKKNKIAIIGLGYVGLPLAIEFGKIRKVIGFDIKKKRIDELNNQLDSNLDITIDQFKKSKKLVFTNNLDDIKDCSIFIVTAPTPVDNKNRPELRILKKACEMIGSFIKKGSIVIFESTVYPGVTEEICAPIIEKKSGMIFNKDFFCGYSPERINPGDTDHNISSIVKVTSGSTPEIAITVDKLYKEIIKAGTYKASNIKVAER